MRIENLAMVAIIGGGLRVRGGNGEKKLRAVPEAIGDRQQIKFDRMLPT